MSIRDHVWEPERQRTNESGSFIMIESLHEVQLIERIMELALLLSEHPASKPYLEKFKLCWTLTGGKLGLNCAKCSFGMCECDDSGSRANNYTVACYCDPALRLLFNELGLAVKL